eukprot:TRINITY_DN20076_c0_g2_i2.p1 TRINITY_DN20076_c0_g2~~TRINITY_DN20076_c0_g2_i2.p1  ORF type:complete len:237 (-),score=42.96 TRINITY_DN20076_c0_g2_i2:97-726(-)
MTDEVFRNECGIDTTNFTTEAKSHGVFVLQDNSFSVDSVSCFPRFGFSCQFRRRYYLQHLRASALCLPFSNDILDVMVSFLEPALLSAGDELELQNSKREKRKVLSVSYEPNLKTVVEDKPPLEFCFDIVPFKGQSCRVMLELWTYQNTKFLPASMVAFDPENVNRWLVVMFTPVGSKYHSRGMTFLHFWCEFPQDYPFKPPSFRPLDE